MKNSIDLSRMYNDSTEAISKKEFKSAVDKEEMANLIRQRPNRKIIGITRMYLWFYNMIDTQKMAEGIVKKEARLLKKNEKRREKGKKEKEYKNTWREWFANEVGEPPVIYDSALTMKSISQIENYLYNKGFFYPSIEYEFKADTLKKKTRIKYIVRPQVPYRINKMTFTFQNKDIEHIIYDKVLNNDSVIYKGDRFDLNDLQRYQKILTRNIREEGYYLFNRSMVYFQADTNLNSHSVNLSLFVDDKRIRKENVSNPNASYYSKYFVDNIYINTSYPLLDYPDGEPIPVDTLNYRNKNILYQYRFRYNPKLFQRTLIISKDSLYSVNETELTFKKLFELGSFDLVNISYNLAEVKDSSAKYLPLDAFVNLNPTKNQSVSFETTTTNNGGNLGISLGVSYTHKNIFKGAEQLRISLTGGVEAQQSLDGIESSRYFNTVEIGPEIELIIPHFVAPFSYSRFKRILNPKTSIAVAYNYQDRPDYKRTTGVANFGYKWNSSKTLFHNLNIFQFSYTKINRSAAFDEYLESLNNAVLEASYTDNVVPSIRYTGVFNNQKSTFQNQVYYTRILLQEAGGLTYQLANAVDAPQNEQGQYLFNGIPFANFFKTEIDFRSYYNFDENNSIAYRINLGSAWALKNTEVLPFQDAFFVGGSNSNRAWLPRTLGPGSTFDSTGTNSFDKIGDIKIDLSAEYRFNLVSFVELAIFADASNVWYMEKENLPKDNPSVFEYDRFISEIAIGVGFGVRLNFSFFIIRFDFGYQAKDPSSPQGERWFFQPHTEYDQRATDLGLPLYKDKNKTFFSLAIGYPF